MKSRAWPLLAFLAVALVALVSALADLGRLAAVQGVLERVPWSDKICHFTAMFAASYAVGRALGERRLLGLPLGAALLTVVTTLEEASQLAFVTRSFDLGDLAANLAGIWGAAFLASDGSGRRAPASTP